MRNIDKLNGLTNPIGHGEQVLIDGQVFTVGQNIEGKWFLHTLHRPCCCFANGQNEFIAEILAYRDLCESI